MFQFNLTQMVKVTNFQRQNPKGMEPDYACISLMADLDSSQELDLWWALMHIYNEF